MTVPPAARPPTVYLHVGAPKSGTTFLQGLLWGNAEALAEHGVLLPGGSFGAHVRATRDLRGVEREPDDPMQDWTGAWDALAAEITASEARAAVVSSEVLCAVTAERAARAVASLAPCEVHVVYSARDLAGLLPSEWQEYVKHRYLYGFDQWLAEVADGPRDEAAAAWFWQVHDIPAVLARWTPHVPPERVHVLTLPGPAAPRELLWERFAGLIGVDPAVADLTEARTNASLSHAETELLRRVNHAVDPDAPMWLYHRLVTDVLAVRLLPGRGAPGRVRLPAARRAWAAERAAELVAGVRAAGHDVVGDLAELLPSPAPADVGSAPADAELLDTAAHTVLGLLDEVAALRAELAELRAARAEQERTALPKLMARHLSERNPAVWRVRVGYWHMVERLRGIEPPPPPDPDAEPEPGPLLSVRGAER
ncbi:hypothetical protein [Actinomadura parmotrematis]|uniref:Sulfotransferase family protein n=1 Tax=Actinomadura parmotrematis TaxID=2864039 RepID=A0ABS7FXY3_9ACTN|nr:hypothetical protein [Actinomadura parmotrematis]MBW8485302.1 hypothetical protein [Actinomadura parmotrematis]